MLVEMVTLRIVKHSVLSLVVLSSLLCAFLWTFTRNQLMIREWRSAKALVVTIRNLSTVTNSSTHLESTSSHHFGNFSEYIHISSNKSEQIASGINETWQCEEQKQRLGRVRLLCWLMCDPENLAKVKHARDSWMKHCDKTLFMSSVEDKSFPAIGLDVQGGRNHIAFKAKAAWKYIYSHHGGQYDYFMKVDPDSYVIVRHLKAYLSHRNPDELEFMGHLFQLPGKEKLRYFSGGPGEVMSRGALKVLVSKVWPHSEKCMPDGQGEDYKISRCLQEGGVRLVDTRDLAGRETMLVFNYKSYLKGGFPSWYNVYDLHGSMKVPTQPPTLWQRREKNQTS